MEMPGLLQKLNPFSLVWQLSKQLHVSARGTPRVEVSCGTCLFCLLSYDIELDPQLIIQRTSAFRIPY